MDFMHKPSKFTISIETPTGVMLSGEIKALSLINSLGPFDVVERHTNFISAIREKIIVHQLDDSKKEIPIETGIIKITKNGTEIYLGIEPLPEKL